MVRLNRSRPTLLRAASAPRGPSPWRRRGVLAGATCAAVVLAASAAQSGAGAGAKSARVVVARRDLPAGHLLSRGDLRVLTASTTAVGRGRVSTVTHVTGRSLTTAVSAGEPVLASKVARRGVTGLAALVPPGLRALTVTADPGPAVRGDRLDVIGVFDPALVGDGPPAILIARRSEVLALRSSDTGAGEAKVTLLVTPEEAERVAFASEHARLVLSAAPGEDDGRTTASPQPAPSPTP